MLNNNNTLFTYCSINQLRTMQVEYVERLPKTTPNEGIVETFSTSSKLCIQGKTNPMSITIYNAYLYSGCKKGSKSDMIISNVGTTFKISKSQWLKNANSKESAYRKAELLIAIPSGTHMKVTRVSRDNMGTYAVFKANQGSFQISHNDINMLFSASADLAYIQLELAPPEQNNHTYSVNFMDLTQRDMMFKGYLPIKVQGVAFGDGNVFKGTSSGFVKVKGMKLDDLTWSSSTRNVGTHDFGIRLRQGIPSRYSPIIHYFNIPNMQKGNPGFIIQFANEPSLSMICAVQILKRAKNKEYKTIKTLTSVGNDKYITVESRLQE